MSHDNEEEHWFRYLDADSKLVDVILLHEPEAEIRRKGETATASFPLYDKKSYEWIAEAVSRFNLAPDSFGVFVSLATEYDSEIVTLPLHVVELVRQVGGRVEFSVTFVAED